ncbi:MAG: DUF2281 domain-containing protein, partial [Candidatus Binatia bacterium]
TEQYEERLLEEIRKLPPAQAQEVLDFAAFLRQKVEQQQERSRPQAARAAATQRMEARRRRIGPLGIKAADLVEEGRTTRYHASTLRQAQSQHERTLLNHCHT